MSTCRTAFETWADDEKPPPSAADLAWRAWFAAWGLAHEAGRKSVLGDLSEPIAEHGDTLPCPTTSEVSNV